MIKGQPDAMDGLFGSLDYISPEALLNKHYCEATDMWATGVILFILLSG
jgi:calcium-dependent protein kinase